MQMSKGFVPARKRDIPNGTYLVTENYEQQFQEIAARTKVVFANDIDVSNKEGREQLNRLIRIELDGESITASPQCYCGKYKQESLRNVHTCEVCGGIVRAANEIPIESTVWMRVPVGVHYFINPVVWITLTSVFNKRNLDVLSYLMGYEPDPKYKNSEGLVMQINRYNFPKGWNNFCKNFDTIIHTLIEDRILYKDWTDSFRQEMRDYIAEVRPNIFTTKLPVPNKVLFVTEKTSTLTYQNPAVTKGNDAVYTIARINDKLEPSQGGLPYSRREHRVWAAVQQWAAYYAYLYSNNIQDKYGDVRKHVIGGRKDHSARGVITPIIGMAHYDELHLPWSMFIVLHQKEINGYILNNPEKYPNYTQHAIHGLLMYSINHETPMVREIVDLFISESPYRTLGNQRHGKPGLPATFQRNPSLDNGSEQLFYITKVKSHKGREADKSISMSIDAVKDPNADFDGDQMNLVRILDHTAYLQYYKRSAHFNIFDRRSPLRIKGKATIAPPVLTTIGNAINSYDKATIGDLCQ